MRSIAIFSLLSSLLLGPTSAQAHAFLDQADPRVGSTVANSPTQVTLHFTQKLEPKFSKADVRNAAGTRVDLGSTASDNVVRVNVKALPAGTYRVHWRVLSVDTHTSEGTFSFHVGK